MKKELPTMDAQLDPTTTYTAAQAQKLAIMDKLLSATNLDSKDSALPNKFLPIFRLV